MKKLAILTMVLVFVLSSVAFAAPSFTGSLDSKTNFDFNAASKITGAGAPTLTLKLNAGEEDLWSLATVFDADPLAVKLGQYTLSLTSDELSAYAWQGADQGLASDLKDVFGIVGTDNRLGDAAAGKLRLESKAFGLQTGVQVDSSLTGRVQYPFDVNSVGVLVNSDMAQDPTLKYVGYGTVVVGPATIKAAVGQKSSKTVTSDNLGLYGSAEVPVPGVEGLTVYGKYYQDAKNFNNKKGYTAKGTYQLENLKATAEYGLNDVIDETKATPDADSGIYTADVASIKLNGTYRLSATEDEPGIDDIFGDYWTTNKGFAAHVGFENYAGSTNDTAFTAANDKNPKTVIKAEAVAPVTEGIIAMGRFTQTTDKDGYVVTASDATAGTPAVIAKDAVNEIYGIVSAKLTEKWSSETSATLTSFSKDTQYNGTKLSEALKYKMSDNASVKFTVSNNNVKQGEAVTDTKSGEIKLSVSF